MDESQREQIVAQVPRRPWWRWVLGVVVGLPLLFVLAVGALWWRNDRMIARDLAAIRARGEPTTADELDAFYAHPPADKDATPLWMSAGAKLSASANTELGKRLPLVGEGPDPPPPGQEWKALPLAEQFLSENAAAMSLLHEAARNGGAARFPHDFSQGFELLRADISNARVSARCLALEARVRAHRNDAAGAADSLLAGFVLARSLENEPLLTGQLVRLAAQTIAAARLKELLPVVDFADEDLVRMENDLLTTDFHDGLRWGLVTERAIGIIAFGDPEFRNTRYDWFVRASDFDSYTSIMRDMIEASEAPWPDAIDAAAAVGADVEHRVGRHHVLARTLIVDSYLFSQAAARGTAQCRIMALAIALTRSRRANGKPPATLDELAPKYIQQVPLDPYSGKAFHYRADESGYVVYSLDGGKTSEPIDAETGARESLLFRWPPKPKPAPTDSQDATPMGEM